MCAGNDPDPGFHIETVFSDPGFVAYMQEARKGYIEWDRASPLVSIEPDPIGHRLRSLLSRAWAALKDFLDPSQFD